MKPLRIFVQHLNAWITFPSEKAKNAWLKKHKRQEEELMKELKKIRL